jgi:DNA-binding NarL/FixJ family response regulator
VIRVLLVDDQPLVRTGLRAILRPEYGFEVAGECGDGVSVAEEVYRLQPDVVVMDVRMPGVSGTEATRRLRQRSTGPPVLVLTTYDDDETLSSALRAGAAGFLLKDSPPEDIHRAVAAVAAGDGWLDPSVCGRVLAAYRPRGPAAGHDPGHLAALTPRELDVLRLMARGHPNQDIARRLGVGDATVKTHVGSILSKLHLRDRAAAIVFAFDHGVVEPEVG